MSVESKLNRLSLDLRNVGLTTSPTSTKSKSQKKSDAVADSWEDDASDIDNATRSPGSDTSFPLEAPGPTHLKSPNSKAIDAERELANPLDLNLASVPPPTPISPQTTTSRADWPSSQISAPRATSYTSQSAPAPKAPTSENDRKRPEKTTATANRLIAGALGIRAPPKTEEQKKYDRAVKEAEIKRKNREKEAKEREKEEAEKANKSMWDS